MWFYKVNKIRQKFNINNLVVFRFNTAVKILFK